MSPYCDLNPLIVLHFPMRSHNTIHFLSGLERHQICTGLDVHWCDLWNISDFSCMTTIEFGIMYDHIVKGTIIKP